jgi:hypothetical protein
MSLTSLYTHREDNWRFFDDEAKIYKNERVFGGWAPLHRAVHGVIRESCPHQANDYSFLIQCNPHFFNPPSITLSQFCSREEEGQYCNLHLDFTTTLDIGTDINVNGI